ncbi:MAG: S26 family signal peptidase [Phycisphaerales bacterium]|jgi:signal peptidase I|nr:S26 family signal peptidase [Phycisphaerales bacterium]
MASSGTQGGARQAAGAKETITSLTIAFVMAFVFRGFVVEGFLIPTGSMAPTLLGKHMRFWSPESGESWAVGPWNYRDPEKQFPEPTQRNVRVHDPATGAEIASPAEPLRVGDRVFVLKYLPYVFEPQRWDVAPFKFPGDARVNYIKRLVGLPGEQIAIADGDIFVRPKAARAKGDASGVSPWAQQGWTIARKPERVQRSMLMKIFDSDDAPLHPDKNYRAWFETPWKGGAPGEPADAGWTIGAERDYRYEGAGATGLWWDASARFGDRTWRIVDRYAYNETGDGMRMEFPVGDVAMSLAIEPGAGWTDASSVIGVVETRGHTFRAEVSSGAVVVRMRAGDAPEGEWTTLASEDLRAHLRPGHTTDVEVWHIDQAISVFINGERVVEARYDWSPAERVQLATSKTLMEIQNPARLGGPSNPLVLSEDYGETGVRWEFSGGPFTLHHVRLSRDLYYQPGIYSRGPKAGAPALATHPLSTLTLTDEQYFALGDNSPASLDGRLWDTLDPWVRELDSTYGVVHASLLIGKAFCVYFPAAHQVGGRALVPDVGRMRLVW